MKTKASIVVMSHLSDAQSLLKYTAPRILTKSINSEIDFAKYVILRCKGDLTKEIDADELWEDYVNR